MATLALDSGVVIALLDPNDAWHKAARSLLPRLDREAVVLSAVAYAEVLVRPSAAGSANDIVRALAELVTVVPVDDVAGRLAASIRASDGLRMPDALVIASAITCGADELATTDKHVAATNRIATTDLTAIQSQQEQRE